MSAQKSTKVLHVNREISWLAFNGRVLQEAGDPSVPLVERLRFLGIFSNNLDEFFRVRVASLHRLQELGKQAKAVVGDNPKKVLKEIQEIVVQQQATFAKHYHEIVKLLQRENIYFANEKQLTRVQSAFVHNYFDQTVRPNLIPILLDGRGEFPYLSDAKVYLAVKMTGLKGTENRYAIVEVPTHVLPRFIELPSRGQRKNIMLLDDVIRHCLDDLFPIFKFRTIQAWTIKVTRDAELDIDDDISKSFLQKISKSVKARTEGDPVRFIFDGNIPQDFLEVIKSKLKLDEQDHIIKGGRYHNFKDFIGFPNVGGAHLEHPPINPLEHPAFATDDTHMEAIAKGDVLLHFPYQKFAHFIDFLREAAIDPAVTSIKITVYRLAKVSRVINALISAARNGKEVVAVIELRARFDEAANIKWSKALEAAGVRVVFGVRGLKVHSKLCLVTRKENGKSVRYAGISTGNFHESTARIYTDHMLFTARSSITSEVNKVFRFFDSNYMVPEFKKLVCSPWLLRDKMEALIDNEIRVARKGGQGYILWKLNNLVDFDLISRLYQASEAGVKIVLLVRGVCSLVPGVEGMSSNIEAYSIVDKFLEHSRIYVFGNNGKPSYYLSSADLMARNIDYRVEVTCPVTDPAIQAELQAMLDIQLQDNAKARDLASGQANEYRPRQGKAVRAQDDFYKWLQAQAKQSV